MKMNRNMIKDALAKERDLTEREEFIDMFYYCVKAGQHVKVVDPFGIDTKEAALKIAKRFKEESNIPIKVIHYKITNCFEEKAVLNEDNFLDAINSVISSNVFNAIVILERISYFLDNDPHLQQRVLDFLLQAKTKGNIIVFLVPNGEGRFPDGIEELTRKLTVPLPEVSELYELVSMATASLKDKFIGNPTPEDEKKYKDGKVVIDADDTLLWKCANALLGMPIIPTQDSLRVCLGKNNGISESLVDLLVKDKIARLATFGITIKMPKESLADLGGLDILKEDIKGIALDCEEMAREFNVSHPVSILLGGVTGTGKSLAALIISHVTFKPLIVYDSPKDSKLGETEKALKRTFMVAQRLNGIVQFDEIEKLYGGDNINSGDPTKGAVLQITLSTMQEMIDISRDPVALKKMGCFICIGTSNNIPSLPIEMINRWQYIRALDLPNATERKEVISIHLKKCYIDVELLNLSRLVAMTKGYSSREISMICNNSHSTAYRMMRKTGGKTLVVTQEVIEAEIAGTASMSVINPEAIKAQREWCIKNRVKRASTEEPEVQELASVKM